MEQTSFASTSVFLCTASFFAKLMPRTVWRRVERILRPRREFRRGPEGERAHDLFTACARLITHHIQQLVALLNYSHFALEALFSTVLLVAETGTGKSLLSLKATENRSL